MRTNDNTNYYKSNLNKNEYPKENYGNTGYSKNIKSTGNNKTGNYEKGGNYVSDGKYPNSGYHTNEGIYINEEKYYYPEKNRTSGNYRNPGTYGYDNNYDYGYAPSSYTYQQKIPGIFGFQNNKVYNNCFMNSSLQNLLHCEEFTKLLHSIPDNNLLDKPLAKEVKSMLNKIDHGEDELNPLRIKAILSEVQEKYKYNEQSDATEFITIFLNQLLKELKGIGKYNRENIPKNEVDLAAFYKLEDKFFLKNQSFLLNLFYGRLKKNYVCEKGHLCLVKFNNYNTLILPQPLKHNGIIDLLKLYQQPKPINDTIMCNECKREVRYSIQNIIFSIPKYLILCLEKESSYYSGINYTKELNTSQFMDDSYGIYELDSIIEYSGDKTAGHYAAKVCQDNKWYLIDDTRFYKIDDFDALSKAAIILFYSRKGQYY